MIVAGDRRQALDALDREPFDIVTRRSRTSRRGFVGLSRRSSETRDDLRGASGGWCLR
jgi:hypothetical protein